jgi:TolA-binding protein
MGRALAVCLGVLVLALGVVGEALALDKNQIVQMSKLGLDANAIKGAIDSAGDELMLTEAELAELSKQGVSKDVLEHLRRTGHVKSEGKPADVRKKDNTMPPDPMAPAPDPAKEQNGSVSVDEAKRMAKELVEAEKQKQEQINQRANRIAASKRKLAGAKAALARGDNMAAARDCLDYISIDAPFEFAMPDGTVEQLPVMSPQDVYEAKFCLAKALYKEKVFSGASRPLVEVLAAGTGPATPHFKEAFYMLEEVSRRIGYRSPELAELTAVDIKGLDEKFQNDFHYFMGKFFFDFKDMDNAIFQLKQVKPSSEDYPEALYLTGVATLGAVQVQQGQDVSEELLKRAPEALKSFQEAILAAEKERGGNEEILQLGYLAMARVFYELGYYDVSLFYYQKLPETSSRNARATYETAWAFFLKNDYKKALGVFHTLHSPYYDKWFFPDLYVLEATVYLNLCNFEKSKTALAALQSKYLDKRGQLQEYIKKMEGGSEEAIWEAMVTYYQQGEKKTGLPRVFADAVLDDLAFFSTYQVVQVLKKERAALQANLGLLGEFGKTVLERVDEQLAIKTREGGVLVFQRLKAIDQLLGTMDLQATQISFDIDSEEKQQIQNKLQNPNYVKPTVEAGTTLLIVADDWHPWPFEGEYWLDEVGSYRSNLKTECVAEE